MHLKEKGKRVIYRKAALPQKLICGLPQNDYICSMIITVTSLKGGVGKSTITQNLAVSFKLKGYSVVIVDVDTNQSCLDWLTERESEENYIHVVGLPDGKALVKSLKGLNDNYDIILIDGTPAIDQKTSRIMRVADLIIVPLRAGKMDLSATTIFLDKHQEAVELKGSDIPLYALLNEFNEDLIISRHVKQAIENTDINLLKNSIRHRTAYPVANIYGLGAVEHSDKKAKKEIENVTDEILSILLKL